METTWPQQGEGLGDLALLIISQVKVLSVGKEQLDTIFWLNNCSFQYQFVYNSCSFSWNIYGFFQPLQAPFGLDLVFGCAPKNFVLLHPRTKFIEINKVTAFQEVKVGRYTSILVIHGIQLTPLWRYRLGCNTGIHVPVFLLDKLVILPLPYLSAV